MSEEEAARTILHIDRSIDGYIRRCRAKIPGFVRSHFGFKQTWEIQRQTFWRDLLLSPVNSAWSIPYLTLKKAGEMLEKLGVSGIHAQVLRVPSGIRTGYQKKIEALICRNLLEWDFEKGRRNLPEGFTKELADSEEIKNLLGDASQLSREGLSRLSVRAVVDQYSSARALVSDLAGTLFTLGLGRLVFGNASLSLGAMAYRFAKWKAHDEAASDFFLGKVIGSAVFNVFPPSVDPWDVRLFLFLLTMTLALASMLCALLSDPIRKYVGLQERRLNALMDEMEKELLVFSHRKLKSRLKTGLSEA